jgi:hypothetical protein
LDDVISIRTGSPQDRHPLRDWGMAAHQVRKGGRLAGQRLRHQVRIRGLVYRLVPHELPVLGQIGLHLIYTATSAVVPKARRVSVE